MLDRLDCFLLGTTFGLVMAPLFFPLLDRAIRWLKERRR